ncbi:uncharacterized protein TNCV_2701371 [Trichonephila clavipes]|nr:uncharacterized protein TNCV_2701371 [Trichonephila clavipes]
MPLSFPNGCPLPDQKTEGSRVVDNRNTHQRAKTNSGKKVRALRENSYRINAGRLAPRAASAPQLLEIFSRTKHQNKTAWIVPPQHHWYQCSRPGGSLAHGFKRQDQTLLARFRGGYLKTMKFSEGFKSFEMCPNCSSELAWPAHILECPGLTKQDLADDPLLVVDFLKVSEVMDLV